MTVVKNGSSHSSSSLSLSLPLLLSHLKPLKMGGDMTTEDADGYHPGNLSFHYSHWLPAGYILERGRSFNINIEIFLACTDPPTLMFLLSETNMNNNKEMN